MTVKLKFKELQIMYTQIKRTNGGEKNNTARSFTFPHKRENQHMRNHMHPRYIGNLALAQTHTCYWCFDQAYFTAFYLIVKMYFLYSSLI